jgi:hypothetical protein
MHTGIYATLLHSFIEGECKSKLTQVYAPYDDGIPKGFCSKDAHVEKPKSKLKTPNTYQERNNVVPDRHMRVEAILAHG